MDMSLLESKLLGPHDGLALTNDTFRGTSANDSQVDGPKTRRIWRDAVIDKASTKDRDQLMTQLVASLFSQIVGLLVRHPKFALAVIELRFRVRGRGGEDS
jgi:hypothetical protein